MSRYRGLAYVLVSVALLFGAMQPVLAQETAERTGLRPDAPEFGKRGPYPVGYRVITIGEDSDHPLEADVWYPALNPDGKAESIAYEFTPKNPDWIAAETGVVLGHALADAPVDAAMAPYPLVVFSHGFSLNPATYSTIPEHYASYGFIVIAPEHIERNWEDSASAAITRPADMKQALDYAETATAPDGAMAGLIDMENVAVVGHSLGGYTALAMGGAQFDLKTLNDMCAVLPPDDPKMFLCAPFVGKEADMAEWAGLDAVPDGLWPSLGDPRVTAIVPISGDAFVFNEAGLAKITVPVMAMSGTADTGTPYEWGAQPTYDYASSAKKALVGFVGAEHMFVGTPCESMPWTVDFPYRDFFCYDPVWDKERALDLVHHFSAAFLLAELKGDTQAAAALAPEAVSFPGIEYQATGFETEM